MRLAPALLFVLLAGCGREVPPPKPPAPKPVVPPPAPRAAPTASFDTPFRPVWHRQTKPFMKGLAVAPSGHLVVLGSRALSLMDPRSGLIKATKEACFTFPDAFGMVTEREGVLVCERNLQLMTLPSLTFRGVRDLPSPARVAAHAKGRVAVGFEDGAVRVYARGDWKEAQSVPAAGAISALALSGDGRVLAIGGEDGTVRVLREGKAPARFVAKRPFEVSALALSHDGAHLVVAAGPRVATYATPSLEVVKEHRDLRGAVAATFVGDARVAVVGRDGLVVVSLGKAGSRGAGAPGDDDASLVALAADRRGRLLCTGRQDGLVRCMTRGGPPGLVLSQPKDPFGPGVRAAGRVVGHQAQLARFKAHPRAPLPREGAKVKLFVHDHGKQGALRTSEWKERALGEVTSVRGDVIAVRFDKVSLDLSAEVDPLPYDRPIMLTWPLVSPARKK